MVFPDPTGVLVKEEIVSSIDSAPRWSQVTLEQHKLPKLSETAVSPEAHSPLAAKWVG
jgi:hypothetical protein